MAILGLILVLVAVAIEVVDGSDLVGSAVEAE